MSSSTWAPWRFVVAVFLLAIVFFVQFSAATLGPKVCAALGILVFIGFAFMLSENPAAIDRRTILSGVILQFTLAFLVLRSETVYSLFDRMGKLITEFLSFSNDGAKFVFNSLADPAVLTQAFGAKNGFIFVAQALPAVIFVSAVFTMLYHLRILQYVVLVFSKLMVLVMGKRGVSGAETLSATANVFMGQTEAPLIVKPYVAGMTRSELLALMIGGMATISGGVMAMYIQFGADPVAILATSVMAAPAGLYISKILVPETEVPKTRGRLDVNWEKNHSNVVDAAAAGASEGMMLVINIVAMLIAFIAIVSMLDAGISRLSRECGFPQITMAGIFATCFEPVALLMGVKHEDGNKVGALLGTKLVLNEFVAYVDLTRQYYVKDANGVGTIQGMDPTSYKLATFALTGFANFASIGIQLGGIGAMAPEKRKVLASLGAKALIGGFLATLLNASIAGFLIK